MSLNFRLWENCACAVLLPPQPLSSTLAITSPYLLVSNAHKLFLECLVAQANAAPVTLTPLQATDKLGTSSKVLSNPAPIASILDVSTATGTDQFSFSSGTSFATDVGLKNKSVIFEIDPSTHIDINNLNQFGPAGPAFNHIAIQVAASNVANLVAVTVKLLLARDVRQNPPTTYL
jgi:hypothetical protein